VGSVKHKHRQKERERIGRKNQEGGEEAQGVNASARANAHDPGKGKKIQQARREGGGQGSHMPKISFLTLEGWGGERNNGIGETDMFSETAMYKQNSHEKSKVILGGDGMMAT